MNAWLMNYGLAEMENLVSCRPLLMKFGWLSRKGVLAHGIPANQQQTNFIQQLSPALKRKLAGWLLYLLNSILNLLMADYWIRIKDI